jgi:hypothetical protein
MKWFKNNNLLFFMIWCDIIYWAFFMYVSTYIRDRIVTPVLFYLFWVWHLIYCQMIFSFFQIVKNTTLLPLFQIYFLIYQTNYNCLGVPRWSRPYSGLVSSFKKYKAVGRVIAATQSRFQERGIKQSIIFPNLFF